MTDAFSPMSSDEKARLTQETVDLLKKSAQQKYKEEKPQAYDPTENVDQNEIADLAKQIREKMGK